MCVARFKRSIAEALSSTAIGALIRPLGLPDMLLHRREALSSRYEGMAFRPNAPHQLTALPF